MTPQGSSGALPSVGGSPVTTQPIARSMGGAAPKLGQQLATGNAGTPMASGGSMAGAMPKLGGGLGMAQPIGGGSMPLPLMMPDSTNSAGSPLGQGFAGATASQQGNPNMGGFGGAGLNAEVTNPGMGFLSGLLSGSNV